MVKTFLVPIQCWECSYQRSCSFFYAFPFNEGITKEARKPYGFQKDDSPSHTIHPLLKVLKDHKKDRHHKSTHMILWVSTWKKFNGQRLGNLWETAGFWGRLVWCKEKETSLEATLPETIPSFFFLILFLKHLLMHWIYPSPGIPATTRMTLHFFWWGIPT